MNGASVGRIRATLNVAFLLKLIEVRRKRSRGATDRTREFARVLPISLVEGAQDIPLDNRQPEGLNSPIEQLVEIPQRNIEIAPDRTVEPELCLYHVTHCGDLPSYQLTNFKPSQAINTE
jgi:hypothetical protein